MASRRLTSPRSPPHTLTESLAIHPFEDGNKRTALVAARTFLILNGVNLEAAQDEKFLTFQRLAEGSLTEAELADWIRTWIQS